MRGAVRRGEVGSRSGGGSEGDQHLGKESLKLYRRRCGWLRRASRTFYRSLVACELRLRAHSPLLKHKVLVKDLLTSRWRTRETWRRHGVVATTLKLQTCTIPPSTCPCRAYEAGVHPLSNGAAPPPGPALAKEVASVSVHCSVNKGAPLKKIEKQSSRFFPRIVLSSVSSSRSKVNVWEFAERALERVTSLMSSDSDTLEFSFLSCQTK